MNPPFVFMTRCECCDLPMPYLSLKVVRREVPARRVKGVVVFEKEVIYRRECRDCREDIEYGRS